MQVGRRLGRGLGSGAAGAALLGEDGRPLLLQRQLGRELGHADVGGVAVGGEGGADRQEVHTPERLHRTWIAVVSSSRSKFPKEVLPTVFIPSLSWPRKEGIIKLRACPD